MKDSEVVQAAGELLADPRHWIKGGWCIRKGMSHEGKVAPVDQFCLSGALSEAVGLYDRYVYTRPMPERQEEWKQVERVRRVMDEIVKAKWPHIVQETDPGWSTFGPSVNFNDHKDVDHTMVMELIGLTHDKLVDEGR